MVQPITAVVLETMPEDDLSRSHNMHAQLTMCYGSANHSSNDEKDASAQYSTFFSPFFSRGSWCHEKIWNNYVDIQDQNMQVIFIILLCTQGYNSLCDPTKQHKVWRKYLATRLNTNWSECIFADWSISWFFFQSIWSNLKQNYMADMIMNVSRTVCQFAMASSQK